jgi:N-acetylmuramoyl-L-alanine amidase
MGDFQNNEQNIVGYDWDMDGKAEVVMRLEEGSTVHMADGTTYTIGADGKNGTSWKNYREPKASGSVEWFTHYGKEFLWYCEGATGKPYQCIEFPLKRLEDGEKDLKAAWGDGYGHRSSKYFFGAPYLDGKHPSLFLGRGIYTRHKFIAYDVDPKTHDLNVRWKWTNNQPGSPWYGQGYHNYIEITMDQVYELDMDYDENYYYFDFLTPHEVYDKVVVVDAGHGGRAPGATKQGINEKDIDLGIVLQLKKIFDNSGGNIGVYYTRTDDSNPTFDQRVQLANKSQADLFISIHNNSTKSGRMSSTHGTQVMYSESDTKELGSKAFAQICLDHVTEALESRDKGLVEGDEIYIIRTSEVPVALIEVGFMTNQEELNLLNSTDYQKKAAEGVYDAVLDAFAKGY